ncbi:MAG: squalene synthase HpnC [Pirellulales bacterium]
MTASISTELARYGPRAGGPPATLAEARTYCRRLARSHYENFSVVSFLVPRRLRQHFCNIYAYCRWSDDLADETGDSTRSLELLDWWRQELEACYAGRATHPVFVALRESIGSFDIPAAPFHHLLTAFRRDQHQTRYETWDELLDYCRYSANPVGHLVLYLGGCADDVRREQSDHICTGLQLVNFCQDVDRDYVRGRVYLPRDLQRRYGVDEAMLALRAPTAPLQDLVADMTGRAESQLHAGLPLVESAPRELRRQVALFAAGGLAIAAAIRRRNFDVWTERPTLGRREKLRLLLRVWTAPRGSIGRRILP